MKLNPNSNGFDNQYSGFATAVILVSQTLWCLVCRCTENTGIEFQIGIQVWPFQLYPYTEIYDMT